VGIPRNWRDFRARWKSRLFDLSTERLFNSLSRTLTERFLDDIHDHAFWVEVSPSDKKRPLDRSGGQPHRPRAVERSLYLSFNRTEPPSELLESGNPAQLAGFPSEVEKSALRLFHGAAFQ
jgi:hypothetical protein